MGYNISKPPSRLKKYIEFRRKYFMKIKLKKQKLTLQLSFIAKLVIALRIMTDAYIHYTAMLNYGTFLRKKNESDFP